MLAPVFLAVTCLLFAVYAVIMLRYRRWFLRLQPFQLPAGHIPITFFSVIIPARNEEDAIVACLRSVLDQQYPSHLLEVIVVDDHSTDNTAELVKQWQQLYPNLQLVSLSEHVKGQPLNSYKKKAIETGIGQARGEWIVTTDADCTTPPGWLAHYDGWIQRESPVFVAAPVVIRGNGSVLDSFQVLDFMALQGITAAAVSAGSHSMCNGANLAYRKNVFYEVDGFRRIDHIASGDDMLLMNRIRERYPQQVTALFTQDVVVSTQPMDSWMAFLNQRVRWASKADKLDDRTVLPVLLVVYFLNLTLLLLPWLAFADPIVLIWWLGLLVGKTVVESTFAGPVARFFGIRLLWWFPLLQFLHIPYTVLAGWLGKFGSYRWKGRKVV